MEAGFLGPKFWDLWDFQPVAVSCLDTYRDGLQIVYLRSYSSYRYDEFLELCEKNSPAKGALLSKNKPILAILYMIYLCDIYIYICDHLIVSIQ